MLKENDMTVQMWMQNEMQESWSKTDSFQLQIKKKMYWKIACVNI